MSSVINLMYHQSQLKMDGMDGMGWDGLVFGMPAT